RLSSSDTLPAIAANRQTEPARLRKLVRGDLDWIVMKALEKDRNRRYESASSLARDLAHYLADEPVEACQPTLVYRLGKALRRPRRLVAALTGAAALLLVAALLAYRGQQLEARRLAERQQHEERLLAEKRQNAIDKASFLAMSGDFSAAGKAIAEAELL